ncbi:aldehyde dehydrogenase family protein, partial [Alphaproteobacteria bacterium]|nr:aldehyde dehydrogenase family protein [Alphaproteobacteria bacterium]
MSIQKTITPIDNSVYLERPLSTQNEIDKVIENSKKSFKSWRNTSIEDRITIINKFI